MIGTKILHYKILEKLGEGGMGVVYKAEDSKLKRTVALKFLPLQTMASEEEKSRFEHEAQAAAALDHPNICTVYEINEADGQAFIAMAYVEGQPLDRIIRRGEVTPPLPLDDALNYATQIAKGLQAAHEKDIVHRDIKPANILLTEKGQVRITDFGLAKLAGRTQLTKEGTSLGTVAYMSPEQTHGIEVDHRTDIWALGAVIYEMTTGEQPFKGDYEQAVIYSILNEDPHLPTTLNAELPLDLENIVLKALAKEPTERYQTIDEMLSDLQVMQKGSESEKALARLGKGDVKGAKSRRNIAFIGIGFILALLAFFVITNFLGPDKNKSSSDIAITDSANRIAVFPFSVRGTSEYDYLSEGMAELLSANLDGAGELKSINQAALLKVISQKPEMQLDTDNSKIICERMDAGSFVHGNIFEAGGRLRINASLYDLNKGSESVAAATAEGTAEELFEMTDNLTAQIIAGISKKPAERLTRLATRTTNSFVALKTYLEGEIYRNSGRIQEGVRAYQQAVAEDTTFALAYYRLAEMATYSPTTINFKEMLESARRYAGDLSERNRLLIEAFYESRQGSFLKAEELYRNIVDLYPDEVDAWAKLGTIQWHSAARLGRSLTAAQESFKRTLYYDPKNLPAVPYLWIMSSWEGDFARCDSLAERLQVLVPPPSEKAIQTLTWLAFSQGDASEQEQIIEQARRAQAFEVWMSSTFLCRNPKIHRDPQQFSNTKKFIRLLKEPTIPIRWRFGGHQLYANLQISRGFWQAWKEEFKQLEPVAPGSALQYQALIYLYPLLAISNSELEDLRQKVLKLNDDPVRSPLVRYYLAGLLSARLGDNISAQSYADSLESHAASLLTQEQTKRHGAMGVDFALSVRAHVAKNEGEFQKGLDLLDQRQFDKWSLLFPWSYVEFQHPERYLRAELLKSLNRYEEALRWYAALPYGYFDFVNLPVSHFKQGEVYETLGQPEKAAEHYAKLIEMWKECDPELQPVLAQAEKSLERLLLEKAREPDEKRIEIESN